MAQSTPNLRVWDWHGLRRRGLREARRMVRSREEAEEVVQDALLRAWRARDTCAEPERPLPWVLAIVRNEALRRLGRGSSLYLEDLTMPDLPAGDPREDVELGIDVRRALSHLEEVDRQLVEHRYERDLTYGMLAEAFGMPEGTVKVRLHRARNRLRVVLKEQ